MTSDTTKLLCWRTVRSMVGNLGRTTWWRLIRAGDAPAPIRISPGRVAWLEADILDWIAARRGHS
jgi:predicted DNA-binding transcriptional regulator AlpA